MTRPAHGELPSPPTAGAPSAFTLIEVLVALAVAALLIGTVAAALIGSLRAEDAAMRMGEAGLVLEHCATQARLGLPVTGTVAAAGGRWRAVTEDVRAGTGQDERAWRLWSFFPEDRPSLRVEVAEEREGRHRGN